MRLLIIIGPPGSGKTSLAMELQNRRWTVADIDGIVSHKYALNSEDQFLHMSSQQRRGIQLSILDALLDDVAQVTEGSWAITVPSGIFDDEQAVGHFSERVKRCDATVKVLALKAELGKLVTRNGLIGPRSASFLMPRREFRSLLESREAVFESLSDAIVDTTSLSIGQVADAAEELF